MIHSPCAWAASIDTRSKLSAPDFERLARTMPDALRRSACELLHLDISVNPTDLAHKRLDLFRQRGINPCKARLR
jgi:hypothetical protein